MKKYYLIIAFLQLLFAQAQSAWPSESWSAATNLTSVMDAAGITDLSGLHWNPVNNRLYSVQGDGHVRVMQLNITTNTFSQIASKTISGGPEGITQANYSANEFYIIDENNYEIRRYTHTASFSTVTLYKHWDLLASPSLMTNTGNTGPEGIVFVPDSFLSAIGFISQKTGLLYTSVKGLGGLFFISSQDGGYIWVYDINPNATDDFAYIGKYQTNSTESCDLSFDRSTGLLYILHNIPGNNKLEVTNLSSTLITGSGRKFVSSNEYFVANPGDSNENIEGFAITSKCPETSAVSAWLCRDVESNEDDAIQQDALRWFNPFVSDGTCALSNAGFGLDDATITVYPNPANNQITVSISDTKISHATVKLINSLGQIIYKKENNTGNTFVLDISQVKQGAYILDINCNGMVYRKKVLKN